MAKSTQIECDFCERKKDDSKSEYNQFTEWYNTDDYLMHFCYNCQNILTMIEEKQITPVNSEE